MKFIRCSNTVGGTGALLRLILCAAAMLLAAPPSLAQENTGSISGTVRDETGAAIPGAKVTASSPTLVRSLEVASDKEGVYRFPKLPVGTYTVAVEQGGFKTSRREGVELRLGDELKLDVTMAAGNVSETVVVSASAEAIDVTSSRTATSLNEKFIDQTPKGRTFNSLLQVAPGVIFDPLAGSAAGGSSGGGMGMAAGGAPTVTTGTNGNNPGGGTGGFSVNGASGSENIFIVDGVDVSNIRNGALGRESAIPFEFVREVQIKTGGLEAEYGGALGGVINVTTRSGGNDFHGDALLQLNTAALNSAPRGFWRLKPSDNSKAEFFRQKEDDYREFFPGFSLGGPVIKDRLNFFGGYYPSVSRFERSLDYSNGARTTTTRVLRHQALARLDYAPTQKIQVNTSFLWHPIRVSGLLLGIDPAVAQPNTNVAAQGGYVPANGYTASFTYTPTGNLILSARYGYKYVNDKGATYGIPTVPFVQYQRATSGSTYTGLPVPSQFAGVAGFNTTTNTFTVEKDTLTRHNVYLDAAYITRLFDRQHSFKAGYSLNRMANAIRDDFPDGSFQIFWGEGFTRGSIQNARGDYGYYVWQDGIRHNASATGRNQGFYIQDAWQVTRRLTLNLGVRFENEFLPPYTKEVNGVRIANPISFGWGDKVAPRLGGAWDVFGDGRWKLSASYGQFYDTMKYELARSSFGGDYWHSRVYKLDNPDITKLNKRAPSALGSLIIDIDNRTIPINSRGELEGIDPDIEPMSQRQWVVSSEHRLPGNLVFTLRYLHQRLVRGIEDIGSYDANENEVYVIGNPGFGQASDKAKTPLGEPFTPKARRDYDGVELRFDQRFGSGRLRNLSYFGSYTWSRLYGNWSGLADSNALGRSQPNVSRAFDLPQGNFDANGKNVFGLLATDRPHTFKLFGSYQLEWRGGSTDFGLAQLAYSGTPISSTVSYGVPFFFRGRGDLGRTPALVQTDLLLAHTISLSERVKARVDMNVTNLFNQGAVTNYNTAINRNGNLPITDAQFFRGINVEALLKPADSSTPPARSPIYGLPLSYQGIREIRLGFRLTF
ncbi:MAG TPA: TonB-dependent receptor [Blastocatellia bacterium]|nr:TonB-dependent receptor [Blastocatellia bacterium]